MPNYKELVESHVRGLFPELVELSFGCRVKVKSEDVYYTAIGKPYHNTGWDFVKVAERKDTDNGLNTLGLEIIGHPIILNHYLRALATNQNSVTSDVYNKTELEVTVETQDEYRQIIHFNLLTGTPSTEEDWRKMAEILEIKLD